MNVAKVIAQNFAKYGKDVGVKGCTLVKVINGTRTAGALSAGTNQTTTSHSATGMVSDYSDADIDGTQIVRGDRQVAIFGASIQGGAVPAPNDQVLIGGETLRIVDKGVGSDPIRAVFLCQCRK